MTSVLLCRTLRALKRHLPPPNQPVRYLILQDTAQGVKIRSFLSTRSAAVELSRAALFRERSRTFGQKYARAIGALNAKHASLSWWALPFTTKNPISTELCRNAASFLLVTELVSKIDGCLVVVCESEAVADQVEVWCRVQGIRLTNAIRPRVSLKRILEWVGWGATLYLMVRTLWARLRLGGIEYSEKCPGNAILLVTLLHEARAPWATSLRDTYFGELPEWLNQAGFSTVTAAIVQGQSVARAHGFMKTAEPGHRVSLDCVLSPAQILQCALHVWRAMAQARRWNLTDATIDGVNVHRLLVHALRNAYRRGDVYRNFQVYTCGRALAATGKFSRCLYPYENRSWEKMLLLGMRQASRAVRMVGYQHASITDSHTNFMLSPEEVSIMPLPDAIVTMGAVTKEWLRVKGRHPSDLLKPGCALRQAGQGQLDAAKERPTSCNRVLVALATSLIEYVQVLSFLDDALKGAPHLIIRVRPHPTLALEQALKLIPGGGVTFRYEVSSATVTEDLGWADAVLYASSTLGLEAVGRGIPAVYLDLGDILNTDPMGEWAEFKWTAQGPGALRSTLEAIGSLSERDYRLRQQDGREYAQAYIHPVNEERLRVFCEA